MNGGQQPHIRVGLPISDLDPYIPVPGGLHSGGLHSGGPTLGLQISDLDPYLLALGVYTLGVYTLGVYSLGLPIWDLEMYAWN